jgi:hypothetical protein
MANTLVLLEKVTVGAAGAASVTFSNIPQTGYNDLVMKVSAAGTNSNWFGISFNGSTANFSGRDIEADGSSAYSYSRSDNLNVLLLDGTGNTANTFSNGEMIIPNYTSSNYKSFSVDTVNENNATAVITALRAGLWSNTSAISSITLTPYTGTISRYSTFSLYGVSNVNTTPTVAPKATGGDIIQTDGTYWYHAFLNSGSFTPATALTCDYLVVAGGGSGGFAIGGGGGAGGFRASTGNGLSPSSYTVTVGAGGASTASTSSSGTDSSINSYVSTGGGYGATGNAANSAGSGGSGGGGSHSTLGQTGGAGNTPSTTPAQGYAGGTGAAGGGPYAYPGGGGGASGVGGNGNSGGSVSGAGAAGANSYNSISVSSWFTATSTGVSGLMAAGGGGGNNQSNGSPAGGGSGGGGNGVGYGTGGSGTANTGSGGGGGGNTAPQAGGAGGSGIVIVRYTVA